MHPHDQHQADMDTGYSTTGIWASSLPKARVLIVDDEASIRVTLRAFLLEHGYDVHVAEDAARAHALVADSDWDVVVTDVLLPGGTGVELLRAIRAAAPTVQVIMMTGDPTVETAAEAVRAGARDYLVKPVAKNAILRSVATAVQLKHLEFETQRLTKEVLAYRDNLERLVEERTNELHASREQLRSLAARLQAVREEERTRVAREIHDVLAQQLTRLKIDLVWLQGRLMKPSKGASSVSLAARVTEMTGLTDVAIQSVQRIATELRPAVLDSLGLCAAVEWLARDFHSHSGIPCHADVPEDEMPLDRDSATATFRILQEALTNVLRHAHASRVEITLRQEQACALLRIADNGCGIRQEAMADPMSIGLAGMRERVIPRGGHFEISGEPGKGTVIEVRFPLTSSLLQGQTTPAE